MAPPKSGGPGARESILTAASAVARAHGVLGLSIDRIIELAGVSKGGFFYHFPSKDALLDAVVTAELDRFDALIQAHVATGLSYAEGLVEAILEFVSSNGAMLGSVNAALASGESIKSLVVQRHAQWFAQLRAQLPSPQRCLLLELAFDGLIFSCSLRSAPPDEAELVRTRQAMRELVA
jgi:AcrR family transcriptional regulator